MRFFEAVGIGVLVVLAVLCLLFLRRAVLARGGGTVEVSVRLTSRVPGRGWAPGFGRFSGDELRWYRMFSFALRPREIFSRRDLAIRSRRAPDGPELLGLPADSLILCCSSSRSTVEVAMTEGALTGFLSWLEAAPPGAASRRFRLPTDEAS
ncbi:DUF2550 domain-containing protein [Actinocatenispora rupis]|uniref:DUF2550 domain-containing protein n=1 Tax=Actinocatenispora rupis TaxID=519421 RepID=A0A8J3J9V6_9ACTN|nr:DUF2550 domain-containing protein [Actinocatenispora rupis]GID12777.1 hypothetical protein Aru02nite_36660 [Actinocatenispora rupis]